MTENKQVKTSRPFKTSNSNVYFYSSRATFLTQRKRRL